MQIVLPPKGGIALGWWVLRVSLGAWVRRKPLVSLALTGVAGGELPTPAHSHETPELDRRGFVRPE